MLANDDLNATQKIIVNLQQFDVRNNLEQNSNRFQLCKLSQIIV